MDTYKELSDGVLSNRSNSRTKSNASRKSNVSKKSNVSNTKVEVKKRFVTRTHSVATKKSTNKDGMDIEENEFDPDQHDFSKPIKDSFKAMEKKITKPKNTSTSIEGDVSNRTRSKNSSVQKDLSVSVKSS